jgi:hypothetical protein
MFFNFLKILILPLLLFVFLKLNCLNKVIVITHFLRNLEINDCNSHSRSVSTRCSSANSSNCINRKSVPAFSMNPPSTNSIINNVNNNQIHINKTPAKRDSSLGKLCFIQKLQFLLFFDQIEKLIIRIFFKYS